MWIAGAGIRLSMMNNSSSITKLLDCGSSLVIICGLFRKHTLSHPGTTIHDGNTREVTTGDFGVTLFGLENGIAPVATAEVEHPCTATVSF